jgi:hypothetical protein
MFRNLQLKKAPHKVAPDPGELSLQRLIGDAALPISLHAINQLPRNIHQRLYRLLIPPGLLTRFDINAITWKGPDGDRHVELTAEAGTGTVRISAKHAADAPDPFLRLELADNSFNGIDLGLLVVGDPNGPRFQTDVDEAGRDTHFGTARRNLAEEERAMRAGLAPGQIRAGLKASSMIFHQLDIFLAFLSHQSIFLEPLTYASAWIFERRGFAYVRGHKLMDTIHHEFQPGGRLHQALDGNSPFRQPDQWRTVRGRAWAIQDGLLAALDMKWDGLRMVKQVGRQAGVETFPGAIY